MNETIESFDWLDGCPLFEGMTPKQIDLIIPKLEPICYESDTTIISQGEENKGLWIISEGCCKVIRDSDKMEEGRTLAILGPGTIFGEMSFFRKTPHSASVRAVDSTTIYKLSRESFAQLRESASDVAAAMLVNLIRVLAERLKLMDTWVFELMESCEDRPSAKIEEWHEFRSSLYREWAF